MEMIFVTLILSVVCSILYRMSGHGHPFPKWLRRWIIPPLCVIWMILFYPQVAWWRHIISVGLIGGLLSTYWDFIGEDNFFLHGLGIGLAFILYPIATGLWIGYAVRCVALSLSMGLWCKFFKNVWVEELFRGLVIGITLPLMMV